MIKWLRINNTVFCILQRDCPIAHSVELVFFNCVVHTTSRINTTLAIIISTHFQIMKPQYYSHMSSCVYYRTEHWNIHRLCSITPVQHTAYIIYLCYAMFLLPVYDYRRLLKLALAREHRVSGNMISQEWLLMWASVWLCFVFNWICDNLSGPAFQKRRESFYNRCIKGMCCLPCIQEHSVQILCTIYQPTIVCCL